MREGSPFTNLLKMMQNEGYNKDVNVLIGVINSVTPLTIKVGDFILDEGDFFIVESLKEHTRTVTLSGGTVSGSTSSASPGPHTHSITDVSITEGTLTIASPLKQGDSVLVLIDNNDFYVIDKVVS